MKLKTARAVLWSFCALMALCLIVCAAVKSPLMGYLAIVFAAAGTIFWLAFGRCPACGRFLGRTYDKCCPHCGEKIPW